ncbi:MAG: DUF6794 domain-containing protein [Chloroflexota bacterium]
MSKYPETVEEAIRQLKTELGMEGLEKLKQFEEADLIKLHFNLGMGIRNAYGLWEPQSTLRDNITERTGFVMHVDDMSMYLIKQLWRDLQDNDLE